MINYTKILQQNNLALINTDYLENEYAGKTAEEIKAIRQDKTQQLPFLAQQELSMRGCRTAFLQFHRFLYALSDIEIRKLSEGMKRYVTKNRLSEDANIYLDQRILKDVIDFHLCIREESNFDLGTIIDIVNDYRQNQALANDYYIEITSENLIEFAKKLIN
uniref:Uncharacterized protein n=1 Tax=viral metagenome TaxID=1070528 RepID=A0A6M3LSU8_9ZZZZ